jgi:hypothetical protein
MLQVSNRNMSVGIAFAEVKMDSGSGSLSSATHKQLGRFRTPLSESDNFGFRALARISPRVHQTLRVTPAMEAEIANYLWCRRKLLD